jgi:DNA (cytosine-5)-methyltransferase 1
MAAYVMQAFGSYDNDAFSADALKARDFKGATDLVTHTLRSDGFDASEDGTGRGTPIVAFNSQSYAQDYSEGRAPTRASEHVTSTFHGTQVRRLTPTECERLQGYPDGWTCLCGKNDGRSVGADPCTCADGPRYRALGNSIAVPCVEWLLRKIIEAEG